jgi:exopolysaccharide production protein ExoQ
MTWIATVGCALVICGFFLLDRDRAVRTSKALWIPVIWVFLVASRPVSQWLQLKSTAEQADQYIEGTPLDALVFGILLAVGLVVLFGRRRRIGVVLRANAPILLFFSYCALSILWSDYPVVALKRWTKAAGDVVMVLIVLTDPDPGPAVTRLFSRPGFVILPLSILFYKYYPDLGRSYGLDGTLYWTGAAQGKNGLGTICLICGLVSIWCLLGAYGCRGDPHRVRRLFTHGALLATALYLLWAANSMTSISCLVMAGTLIVITSLFRSARRPASVHFIIFAMVGISIAALFVGVGAATLGAMGRDPTLTGRTAIWTAVLSMKVNPLLGTGFESFWLGERLRKVWDLTAVGLQEAHNGYIEIYLNLGWIGLSLLAALIVAGYRNAIGVFRRDPDAGQIRLAFFLVAVVYSFTEAGFRMMSPVWIAFLWATLAVPRLRSMGDRTLVRQAPPQGAFVDPRTTPTYDREERI